MQDEILDLQRGRSLFVLLDESIAGKEDKDGNADPTQEGKHFADRGPEPFIRDTSQKLLRPGQVEGTLILAGETEPGLVHEIVQDDGNDRQPAKFVALIPGQRLHRIDRRLNVRLIPASSP